MTKLFDTPINRRRCLLEQVQYIFKLCFALVYHAGACSFCVTYRLFFCNLPRGVAREFRQGGARPNFPTKGCGHGEIFPGKGVAHVTIDDPE